MLEGQDFESEFLLLKVRNNSDKTWTLYSANKIEFQKFTIYQGFTVFVKKEGKIS